jgi:hypothetical protein
MLPSETQIKRNFTLALRQPFEIKMVALEIKFVALAIYCLQFSELSQNKNG